MDLSVANRVREHKAGESQDETVMVPMIEFDRAASENSIQGFDHGWAREIFLVTGLLKVKQDTSDWPGFGSKDF